MVKHEKIVYINLVFALICISLGIYNYLSQPTPIGYQKFKKKITFTPAKQYQPAHKTPTLEPKELSKRIKELRKRIKLSEELLRRIK